MNARARTEGPLRVRVTSLPADFASIDERAVVPLLAALEPAVVSAYPALGIVTVAGTPKAAKPTRDLVDAVRAQVEGRGGSLLVEVQPESGDVPFIDPWGTPPPSFALMRQLKSRFDPDARLAPGSFIGGL